MRAGQSGSVNDPALLQPGQDSKAIGARARKSTGPCAMHS
jgi:hypothetical protein